MYNIRLVNLHYLFKKKKIIIKIIFRNDAFILRELTKKKKIQNSKYIIIIKKYINIYI